MQLEPEVIATRLKAANLSLTQLAEVHNQVASKTVQKFSDKPMALRRTSLALSIAGKDYDGAKIVDAAPPTGGQKPAATEPTKAPATAAPAKNANKAASAQKLQAVVTAAKEKKDRRKVNKVGSMKFPEKVGIVRGNMKQSNAKGRDWQEVMVTLPDGTKIKGTREMKRGVNFYFTHSGNLHWAKVEAYPNYDLKNLK